LVALHEIDGEVDAATAHDLVVDHRLQGDTGQAGDGVVGDNGAHLGLGVKAAVAVHELSVEVRGEISREQMGKADLAGGVLERRTGQGEALVADVINQGFHEVVELPARQVDVPR
jgi:hypothetical protein